MNTVSVQDDRLVVEPHGLDRVLSFHSRIEVPLDHVVGATIDPGIAGEPKGVRAPGLAVPGKWAGTFVHDGERSFWNVGTGGTPVVIRLREEAWDQLVLSVDRPESLVRLLDGLRAE